MLLENLKTDNATANGKKLMPEAVCENEKQTFVHNNMSLKCLQLTKTLMFLENLKADNAGATGKKSMQEATWEIERP